MAQHDREGLAAWFHERLRDCAPIAGMMIITDHDGPVVKPEYLEPAEVACVLRETGLTLAELDIDPSRPVAPDTGVFAAAMSALRQGNFYWEQIDRCMREAQPDDALVIFKAMAHALEDEPLAKCATLMRDVMLKPWGVQAVQAAPAFFLKEASYIPDDADRVEQRTSNAFQVLATTNPNRNDPDHDKTLHLIQALQSIGVRDTPDVESGESCLHTAAYYLEPQHFAAFLQVFRDDVMKPNKANSRPMDYAAMSLHTGNARMLLAAGASPKSFGYNNYTPLDRALQYDRFDNALILIDTGAYCDDEVDRACTRTQDADLANRVKAYQAARKATQAITDASNDNVSAPRPL